MFVEEDGLEGKGREVRNGGEEIGEVEEKRGEEEDEKRGTEGDEKRGMKEDEKRGIEEEEEINGMEQDGEDESDGEAMDFFWVDDGGVLKYRRCELPL